ncbi:DEAD/DEAH box helicase [Amycolatopsis sp. NPDC051758]|uniref:DEAD/DEAH box helicase n=1 Tax=Amycolatopsis sp. NPDC051758 TaxID=3363935 RepID=UPI00378F8B4B
MDTEDGSYFEHHKTSLRLTIPGPLRMVSQSQDSGTLRRAQLGAAFAVAAHFTSSQDAALVSMPTGSGKSAVMTLLPFLLGSKRILVVTPSRLLRDQLETEFMLLRVLRRTGVVQEGLPGPRTTAVSKRLSEEGAWEDLRAFDVVIGTPNVLSPAYQSIVDPPAELFDLIVFDEGHHTPAHTYLELLRSLGPAPMVLFTATPMRRDKQPLPATPVYTYSLTQALADQVLSPIDFHPVEVAPHAGAEERDTALATAAITRVKSPQHARSESKIIARTSSVKHAEDLVERYRCLGAPMGLITAKTSISQARKTLRQVEDGFLHGLVSVGVLGEGFDMPRLKVAAYHRPHSTLPATLQFLGRITRLLPAGLLAIREDVNDETRDLYNSDVAWATLVPALADAAVADEARRREYLRSFDPEPTEPLSLAGIHPRKDVQVFRVREDLLDLRTSLAKLGDGDVVYQGCDADGQVLVVVTEHLIRPDWLAADTLDRFGYEIHVAVHHRKRGLVFVHGTRDKTVADLLEALNVDAPRMIDPIWLDRLMNSLAVDNYHSVGMRSARAAGGRLAAYRTVAGTKVGDAVLPAETRSYGTGHGIARVYDPMIVTADMVADGKKPPSASITSLGVSYGRAKVFSPDHVGLLAFRDWCLRLGDLAHAAADTSPAGLPGLALLSPRRLDSFPPGPYLAQWEPTLLGTGLQIRTFADNRLHALEEVILTVSRVADDSLQLCAVIDDVPAWRGNQDLNGRVHGYTTPELRVVEPGALIEAPMSEFLTEFLPTVFYADGTSSVGSVKFQPQTSYDDLGPDVLKEWPFEKVDIRREAETPRDGLVNIKTYTARRFTEEPTIEFVIDDDRAGEVADLIAIGKESGGRRPVSLVHLKYTEKNFPGVRVGDLYEVAAQASRSVAWLSGSRLARRLTDRLSSGSSLLTGLTGQLDDLFALWLTGRGQIDWTVVIVQPGLITSRVNSSSNVKTILSDTLQNVTQFAADLIVYGSPLPEKGSHG